MITEGEDRFIQTVVSVVKKGSSRPITAIASDGQAVFVKLNGGLSSPTAAISEMLSRAIGRAIGLPIIEMSLITLDHRADTSRVDTEVRDLLQKSYGLNTASVFYPDAIDVDLLNDSVIHTPVRERIFIYDLLLMNVDRSFANSNLLHIGTREYSIDYEASFMVMGALHAKDYLSSDAVRRALRHNPLYRPGITDESIAREFDALAEVDIASIVMKIPDAWFMFLSTDAGDCKRKLIKSITQHITNKDGYIELYRQLESIEFISEQERKRRNLENRNRFAAKYTL